MWIARFAIKSLASRLVLDPEFRDRTVDACRKAAPVAGTMARNIADKVKDSPPVKDPAAFGRTTGRTVRRVMDQFRSKP